jgi:hypothetical protein
VTLSTVLFTGAAATAATVDISATSATGTTFHFTPGDYLFEWIGTADGGAFNGWNGSCPTGTCTSGWTEQFSVTTSNDPGFIQIFNLAGNPTFASASAALAAYRSAASIARNEFVLGTPLVLAESSVVTQPWIVQADSTFDAVFRAGDGSPTDNFGGVSLRVTSAPSVPEPATWAMMILGMGFVGVGLRLRRRTGSAIAV